jgi:protein-disulfide isomerase
MDAERLARDLDEGSYRDRVEADMLSGARSGVNGTPAFFINGERFGGDWTDVDLFVGALQKRL